MKEFLELTLIEIQEPKAYGLFHIISAIILLSLAVFLAWKLKNTNEKQHKIVLASVGIGLLLWEMYKILVHVIVDLLKFNSISAYFKISLICLCTRQLARGFSPFPFKTLGN